MSSLLIVRPLLNHEVVPAVAFAVMVAALMVVLPLLAQVVRRSDERFYERQAREAEYVDNVVQMRQRNQ